MLVSWVNIAYYQELMAGMRSAIADGQFEAFAARFKAEQAAGDIPVL
jgi:queuine tRNA-ribosyltransferase